MQARKGFFFAPGFARSFAISVTGAATSETDVAFRESSLCGGQGYSTGRRRHMSRSAYSRNLAAPFHAVNITGGFEDSNFRCQPSTTVTGPPLGRPAAGGHPRRFPINPPGLPGCLAPVPGRAGTGSAPSGRKTTRKWRRYMAINKAANSKRPGHAGVFLLPAIDTWRATMRKSSSCFVMGFAHV